MLVAIVALTFVPAALANFAPRFWGDVTAEAWGIKEVAITHEQLTIDLRPLVTGDPARVEVTYDLMNSGASKHLELLFVSGEVGIREFEARIGDKPVKIRALSSDESRSLWKQVPTSWRPPDPETSTIPGLENRYYAFRGYNKEPDLVGLSLELPSGASTLKVRYLAHACGTDGRPTVTWLLPYVLAPAREWGGFGRLDVVVYVPENWDARSMPALDRDGHILRGTFTGLPSDSLLLVTGAPVPPEYDWAVRSTQALWAIVLLGGPVMCWWAGRRLRGARTGGVLLRILPGLLWGALIYAAIPVSMRMVKASLHGQESPSLDYPWFTATVCLVVFIIPSSVLIGLGLTLWSASLSNPIDKKNLRSSP